MAVDMTARMLAFAKNGGGGGGASDTYSRAEIDQKLGEIVQMLAECVKNTDYAGNGVYGTVKLGSINVTGLAIAGGGELYI